MSGAAHYVQWEPSLEPEAQLRNLGLDAHLDHVLLQQHTKKQKDEHLANYEKLGAN
jgi:hypothetical protein